MAGSPVPVRVVVYVAYGPNHDSPFSELNSLQGVAAQWYFLPPPPNIRQKIIEIVLRSPSLPPLDHSAALVSPQKPPHDWNDGENGSLALPYGPNSVRFQQLSQDFPFVSQATPLLLTNRQIREEMQATIRRLGEKVKDCNIDVLFINEQETQRMWTCAPCARPYLDC